MKNELEAAYDIPFSVQKNRDGYIVSPANDMRELFVIHAYLRSEVRMILEIYPQDHAADMLSDMANASETKKKLFLGYLDEFVSRGFRITVRIGGNEVNLHQEWPDSWRNLYIRITRIENPEMDSEKEMVKETVLASGMMLSLLNVVPVEKNDTGYDDGRKISVVQNRYERNPLNRELCLQANGYTCRICGFDFEKKYGTIGRHFIHVHHISQLSLQDGPVAIDPVHDLIPVCPNCHAMLHRKTPPYTPDELRKIIEENDGSGRN